METAPRTLRDRIIDVSSALFYSEGIRGVGIDRIIDASGVAKATLYKHFRSKDELVVAYLKSRHQRVIESLKSHLLSPSLPPQDQVMQVFGLLENKAESDETFRGCAFLMAVSEYGNNAEVVEVARRHKACVRDIFSEILGNAGPLPATDIAGIAGIAGIADIADIAGQLALLYDGALAQIMVQRTSAPAAVAGRCAAALVSAWMARRPGDT